MRVVVSDFENDFDGERVLHCSDLLFRRSQRSIKKLVAQYDGPFRQLAALLPGQND